MAGPPFKICHSVFKSILNELVKNIYVLKDQRKFTDVSQSGSPSILGTGSMEGKNTHVTLTSNIARDFKKALTCPEN